jgi:hypothetical protein
MVRTEYDVMSMYGKRGGEITGGWMDEEHADVRGGKIVVRGSSESKDGGQEASGYGDDAECKTHEIDRRRGPLGLMQDAARRRLRGAIA